MRLVSWNANCRFRDKIALFPVDSHDVLVIQECENTVSSNKAYSDAGWKYLWMGTNQHKGMGIFVPANRKLKALDWQIEDCRYFLPVQLANHTNIVGVWAMGGNSKSVSYAGQMTHFLHNYEKLIKKTNPIIVGDFNSNSIWDKRHKLSNHTANNAALESLGYRSLYHNQTSCAQGEEPRSTFFLYRHPGKPYHIDYVYLPRKVAASSAIELGEQEVWLDHSDHIPLFVDTDKNKRT